MNGLRKSLQVSLRSALLGSVFAFASLAGAQATSLEDAVKMSLATNPDIGIVAHNREAVDEELRQARGLYLPSRAGAGHPTLDGTPTGRGPSPVAPGGPLRALLLTVSCAALLAGCPTESLVPDHWAWGEVPFPSVAKPGVTPFV